jgi:TonB family protein
MLFAVGMLTFLLIGCGSAPGAHPDAGYVPQRDPDAPLETPPSDREMYFAFDKYPIVTKSAQPEWPDAAKRPGVTGTVTVMVVIDETGAIEKVWVSESDNPILNDAALEAAWKFRFTSAESKGTPVKATISIPFRFSWPQ